MADSTPKLEYSPELAEQLAQELEPLSAEELLGWAAEKFGDCLCLTCSWQKQSSALVHMLSDLDLSVDVIELDTQLFFRETYALRDLLVERYGLNLISPEIISVAQQHLQEGPNLWERDPDRCCQIRKVEPLLRALEDYEIWFTGLRREQSPTRANLELVERHTLPSGKQIAKVNPLAFWNRKEVWSYLRANEIDYLPLYDRGYESIGCQPCTTVPIEIGNPRSGRWGGAKLECGIHTFDREAHP